MKRVRSGERGAVGPLLDNALRWERDWWNVRTNERALRADAQVVRGVEAVLPLLPHADDERAREVLDHPGHVAEMEITVAVPHPTAGPATAEHGLEGVQARRTALAHGVDPLPERGGKFPRHRSSARDGWGREAREQGPTYGPPPPTTPLTPSEG